MDGAALRQFDEPEEMLSDERPLETKRAWAESELEFYTRRAIEERRLASTAVSASAAAAHLYLAASYSARMAEELSRQAELEKLALSIEP